MIIVQPPVKFSILRRWEQFDRLLVVGWNESQEEFFVCDWRQTTELVNQCCTSWWRPHDPVKRLARLFADDWSDLTRYGECTHVKTIVKGEVARTQLHVIVVLAGIDVEQPKWQQLKYRLATLEQLGLGKLNEPVADILVDLVRHKNSQVA